MKTGILNPVAAFLLLGLCYACSEETTPVIDSLADMEKWDCGMDRSNFHEAFLKCVEAMRGGYGNTKPIEGVYNVRQCEEYAHRLYCKPVTETVQEAKRIVEEDIALIEQLKKHRRVLCAALMGTCHELNSESKRDHYCQSACIIDNEDISKEVEEMNTDVVEKEE